MKTLSEIEITNLKVSSPSPIDNKKIIIIIDPNDETTPDILWRMDSKDVVCQRYIWRWGDRGLFMISIISNSLI